MSGRICLRWNVVLALEIDVYGCNVFIITKWIYCNTALKVQTPISCKSQDSCHIYCRIIKVRHRASREFMLRTGWQQTVPQQASRSREETKWMWGSFGDLWSEAFSVSKMSVKRAEGMSIAQALAMTVAEIPVFLYSTFGQVRHMLFAFYYTSSFLYHMHTR